MKPASTTALIITCLCFAVSCFGAATVLKEWDFTRATGTLGWNAVERPEDLKITDGALCAIRGKEGIKLESPIFDIPATPFEYLEFELKTDRDGSGVIYYSSTTDEPYHGFRPGVYASFTAKGDGKFHTIRVQPFWQKQSKIIHIRLDPPGEKVAIRTARILSMSQTAVSQETSWNLAKSSAGWGSLSTSARLESTSSGARISGDANGIVMSPPISIDADANPWATLRIASKTDHTVLFRWASDQADGVQAVSAPVRGDGLVHSYPVEVGETGTWAGRIVAVGITPSDSDKNQTCTLESIAFGESPVGPPELRIARFSLDCPFIRVGQKGKLVVEVKNIGGSDAESVRASVALGKQALPAKRVERLGPGLTATLQWDIESNDGAPLTAACHVTGKGLDAGRRSIKVRFHPKLPQDVVRSLDYVPEPVPADTGDYLVGAYYFPGWHTYERWAVLDDFPERRPILGYYREGDPEIVDWQINWALSHGISYFIYDWYWSAGGRHLEHGLHKAFLKSKYQDKMKFCLLWANHNPPNTSSEQDMIEVTKYWIENYFKHPSYLKVNGKNVMVIFSPHRFTEDMGEQAVKASFDKMRKLCEHAGVGGLYIVACTYPSKANTDLLIREGYDALSGYNYPSAGNKGQRQAPYAWMVDGYKEWWNRIADDSTLPYIPVCEPGWDSRPWHGPTANVRTGKTPQLWRKMLENAKGFVDDPKHKQHSDKKLVFLEAWNEFGEGDYIEPHAEFGFDYVEAVRRVFAPTSKQPTIVVPKDIGMGPYDLPIPPPLTEWDFATPESHTWSIGNMSDFGFSSGVMRATAQNSDPAFYSPYIDVAAGEFTKLVVRMRLDKGTEGQLFFARKGAMMTEEKSIHFKVTPDSEFHDYTLDLSANSRWRGSIGQLRLDPCDTQGAKVEIESIRFK